MFRSRHIVEFVLSSHVDRRQNGVRIDKKECLQSALQINDPQDGGRGAGESLKRNAVCSKKAKYNPPMPVRYDKQFGELAYPIPGGIIARGNGTGGT